MQEKYLRNIAENARHSSTNTTVDSHSEWLVKTMRTAYQRITLNQEERTHHNEIWKEDAEFNRLLLERSTEKQTSHRYKELTSMLKKRTHFLKNLKARQEADSINIMATNREIEDLYKTFKSDSSAFQPVTRPQVKCKPEKLKDHFSGHFSQEEEKKTPIELNEAPNFLKDLQADTECINVEPPSDEELLDVVNRLKSGKAANDIPAAFVKLALQNDEFFKEIKSLYTKIWQDLEIPKTWSHTKLVAIWKGASKGKADNPEAYRGLQIGSSLGKILLIIIINRIKKWYEKQLLDQQQGFRTGRGTINGIYVLKRVQQIFHKTKRPCYALFVDLTAAFDKINRKWLFKSIRQRIAGSQKLIDIIEKLYAQTTTALAETPEDVFEVLSGVRQGGPESPMLYNLYMDYVMRLFEEECSNKKIRFPRLMYRIPETATEKERVMVGCNTIDWIGYADDLVLFFMDKRSMQEGLNVLNDLFERFSLKLNTTKTKTMILSYNGELGPEYPTSVVKLAGKDIENVTQFRYLGSEIRFDEPGTGNAEIDFRIDTAQCKFYEHSKKFFNKHIAIKTRTKLLNALVRSRLTYACQTWSLNLQTQQRVNSAYMGMLRKMVRQGYKRVPGTYRFYLSNADLLNICGTQDPMQYIARQQKKFVGHIIRESDTTSTKRLLFNCNPQTIQGRQMSLLSRVLMQEQCSMEDLCVGAVRRDF